jgi:hypothetical protein
MKPGYETVICSYKWFNTLTKRYPKRKVMADMYVEYDQMYYWSRSGYLREVHLNNGSIWISITDEDNFPSGFIKRIR